MELVHDGKTMLMISRKRTPAIPELGPKQIAWLNARFPGISRNRVSRLADHERASAAYRIADLVDEARQRAETV